MLNTATASLFLQCVILPSLFSVVYHLHHLLPLLALLSDAAIYSIIFCYSTVHGWCVSKHLVTGRTCRHKAESWTCSAIDLSVETSANGSLRYLSPILGLCAVNSNFLSLTFNVYEQPPALRYFNGFPGVISTLGAWLGIAYGLKKPHFLLSWDAPVPF